MLRTFLVAQTIFVMLMKVWKAEKIPFKLLFGFEEKNYSHIILI